MLNAGIDTSVYSVHLIRAASSTTAVPFGTPVKKVMAKAGWKNVDTFITTYFRPNLKSESKKSKYQNSGITAGFRKLTPNSILTHDENRKNLRQFRNKGHISEFWSNQSVKNMLGHKLIKGNLAGDESSVTTENTNYKEPSKSMSDQVSEMHRGSGSAVDSDGLTKVSSDFKSSIQEEINTEEDDRLETISAAPKFSTFSQNQSPKNIKEKSKDRNIWDLLQDKSEYDQKHKSEIDTCSQIVRPKVDDYTKFDVNFEVDRG